MPKELTGPEALHAIARLANQWEAADQYILMLETRLAVKGQLIPQRPLPRHAVTPTDRRI